MPEHIGAELVHTTVAAVVALSANLISPPGAIVTRLAGTAEPWGAQPGQLSSTQISLTSSFASGGVAASAGRAATAAPTTNAAKAKSKSVRDLIVNPPLSRAGSPHDTHQTPCTAAACRLVCPNDSRNKRSFPRREGLAACRGL